MTNLRITRINAQGALDVAYETGDVNSKPHAQAIRAEQVKKDLLQMQAAEPWAGWRLETRGQYSDWHVWK